MYLIFSQLKRTIKKNSLVFKKWKKNYIKDRLTEEFQFLKNNFEIILSEDLREHSIVINIKENNDDIFLAGYREICINKNNYAIENLLLSFERINKGDIISEVQCYINFLIENNIL